MNNNKDWIEVELGKLLKLKNGYAFKSSKYKPEGIPIIRISDINQGIVTAGNAKRIEENEEYDDYQVEFGDILIAMSGATTGKFGIYKETAKTYQNQRVGNLKLHSDRLVSKQFIYYLLYSLKNRVIKDAYGGAQPNISAKKIEAIKIPLAPLPEQRAIVSKIEQLFSELDNGITNLKQAQDKLEIYRQAVLKKAFEGELTKNWREKRGLKYSDWKNVTVKDISEIIQYGYTESTSNEEIGPKFLRITDIQDNKVNWKTVPYCEIDETEVEKYLLNDGDLVFARTGATVGKSFLIKGDIPKSVFASYLIRIRFPGIVHDKYVWNFFQSHLYWIQIKKKSVGTGQPNVNGKKLGAIQLPLCSKDEQTQIVHEIETRLSVCDNILANIEEGLEKSEALRQSILKQAFEGKLLSEEELEACKAAPDWEPAEQLLARIKAGKETSVKKKKAPAKQPQKKKIHHVEYYKRTLLAAEIVWQLHQQPTLGHLKLQKLIYLCQESGNMQLPTNFLQQAAGPYDPQMARSIDKQLKTKKWFAYQKDELLKYASLENAGGHQADFNKYYANDIDNIQKVINLFRTAKSDQIEIVATLYACWKKIIQEKAVFSENLLIKRFYEWSEEKSKYSESRVKKAAEWMQEEGIFPDKEQFLLIDNTSHA